MSAEVLPSFTPLPRFRHLHSLLGILVFLVQFLKLKHLKLLLVLDLHKIGENVDWYGEYNGAVVLRRDAVKCLQISQLKIGEKHWAYTKTF